MFSMSRKPKKQQRIRYVGSGVYVMPAALRRHRTGGSEYKQSVPSGKLSRTAGEIRTVRLTFSDPLQRLKTGNFTPLSLNFEKN